MEQDLPSSLKDNIVQWNSKQIKTQFANEIKITRNKGDDSTDNDLSTIKEMESMETKRIDESVLCPQSHRKDQKSSAKKTNPEAETNFSKYINYPITEEFLSPSNCDSKDTTKDQEKSDISVGSTFTKILAIEKLKMTLKRSEIRLK